VSSSRNAQLAKLLEDVEVPGTGRTVCENRGSGLVAAAAALRTAGIEPPELTDKVREFRVVIRNSGLLDDEALRWLTTLNTDGLVDRQRLGLAYLHRNRKLTNQQYRALTGCDALTATRELTGLASLGLIDKSNDRRWAVWHLRESRVATPRLQLDNAPKGDNRAEKPREAEIKALLIGGPESTRSLAQSLGISQQAVRNWVRAMESRGEVESTESNRLSPKNRWRLVDEATR
jgi:ATP-dependent DNA helicase RecG